MVILTLACCVCIDNWIFSYVHKTNDYTYAKIMNYIILRRFFASRSLLDELHQCSTTVVSGCVLKRLSALAKAVGLIIRELGTHINVKRKLKLAILTKYWSI